MLTKLLPAKVAALAATITIGAATAAAATGNLPNSAQTATSGAMSHVGISIPKPNSHTSTENGKASMSGGTTANADFGQCNGFLAGSGSGRGRGSDRSPWWHRPIGGPLLQGRPRRQDQQP
jgi:hypothetical protein